MERKNAFLGYKNNKFKSRKIDIFPKAFLRYKNNKFKSRKIDKKFIFPKGLTHGFGPKMASFPTFFLGNIGQENVFYDILERKNAFLGYKNKKFKKWKN